MKQEGLRQILAELFEVMGKVQRKQKLIKSQRKETVKSMIDKRTNRIIGQISKGYNKES